MDGLLNSLLNLEDYTPLELILFGGGCYIWVFVYAIYIRNIIKLKYIEMPVFAACGNIAWEFIWGFVFQTDMGKLLVWCYQIWFFFDLFIFYSILRYGWKQIETPVLRERKTFVPVHIVLALGWGLMFLTMHAGARGAVSGGLFSWLAELTVHFRDFDTSIGAVSAFMLNLTISSLYVLLIVRQNRESLKNFSFAVAWLKMLGTGMNTVFMNIHYADNYFLRYLAIATTTVDCIYIALFWRLRRQARAES